MIDRLLSMTWSDVLFVHWPVEPEVLRSAIPDPLSIDTYDGHAWASAVAFVMEDLRPPGSPVGLSFPELNLRTYVSHDGVPGIYFFTLDADDRIGVPVARRLFGLPYRRARMNVVRSNDGEVTFRSERTGQATAPLSFDATYGPIDEPSPPEPGSLEAFLTERYRFYAVATEGPLPRYDPNGTAVYAGEIAHEPWPLSGAEATIRRNDLFRACGLPEPETESIAHYASSIDVSAGRVRRVDAPGTSIFARLRGV